MLRFFPSQTVFWSFLFNDSIFVFSKLISLSSLSIFHFFFKKIWLNFNLKKHNVKFCIFKITNTLLLSNKVFFLTNEKLPRFVNYSLYSKNLMYCNFFSNFFLKKSVFLTYYNYLCLLNNYSYLINYNLLNFFSFFIFNKNYFLLKKLNNLLLVKKSTNLLFNFNVKFV